MKKFFWSLPILFVCSLIGMFAHYFRYRYIPMIAIKKPDQIVFKTIEGYTDRLSYKPTIRLVYIREPYLRAGIYCPVG